MMCYSPKKSKGRRQAFLESESQRLDIIAGLFGGGIAMLVLLVLALLIF